MKQKPEDLGKVRVCSRHAVPVKECPRCNIECRAERHIGGNRGPVDVPVYRKRIAYTGKIYKKGGDK